VQDDMAVFVKWCHVSSLVRVTIKTRCATKHADEKRDAQASCGDDGSC